MSRFLVSAAARAAALPLRAAVLPAVRPAAAALHTSARAGGPHQVPVGPMSNIDGVYRRPQMPAPTAPVRDDDDRGRGQEEGRREWRGGCMPLPSAV